MPVKTFCDKCGIEVLLDSPVQVEIRGLRSDPDKRKSRWDTGTGFIICQTCGEDLLQSFFETSLAAIVQERSEDSLEYERRRKCLVCGGKNLHGLSYREKSGIRFVCGECLTGALKGLAQKVGAP